MREFVVPLSFTKPPLNANQRWGHWAQRAKVVREVRFEASLRARSAGIGRRERIEFELHYQPRDKRRRDRGNLMPTHKACLDGVVDAGVVPDDSPEFVEERMPVIHPAVKGERGRMWFVMRVPD